MRIRIDGNYDISRIIKGGWHLAGDHGPVDPEQALHDMAMFVESGITTFDCADIYTGVESLIGRFRARYPQLARELQIHTKFVPDLGALAKVDGAYVERSIDRSLERLGVERLDLVQFHWWDYDVPGYVEAALQLSKLKDKGKIAHIGATNFDVPRLREILDAGVPVHFAAGAVFASRPAAPERHRRSVPRAGHRACCATARWPEASCPSAGWARGEPGSELTNRSLIKYKLIIDDFGGWAQFQQLLLALDRIAVKHRCDIATVASRAVLDWDRVAAIIVGATNTSHLHAHRENRGVAVGRRPIPRPSRRCWRKAAGPRATCSRSSATDRAGTAAS